MLDQRKLRTAIKSMEPTQKKLIEAIGMKPSTFYHKLGDDKGKFYYNEAEKIAEFLEKPVSDFFEDKKIKDDLLLVAEPSEKYACPECVHKQKIIDGLNAAIKYQEELLMLYRQIHPDKAVGFEKSCG